MKKGISLIVLVITIIVMIIIAGAIIISLNSTSVIDKANTAVTKTDVGTLNDKLTLAYVDVKATYPTTATFTVDNGATDSLTIGTAKYDDLTDYYETVVPEIKTIETNYSAYHVVINANGSAAVVED